MLKYPLQRHIITPICRISLRQLSQSPVMKSYQSFDEHTLDSSVNTMERILSILHNAHGSKLENRDSVLEFYKSDPIYFEKKQFASLGDSLFDLKVIEFLIQLQLKSKMDVFKNSTPTYTRNTLQRYISALKRRNLREHPSISMEALGRSFKENPRQANNIIHKAIKRTTADAMKDISMVYSEPPIHLDFCRIKLFNPFRKDPMDPFVLRKGLSTKKYPANLFGVMIADLEVLTRFLEVLKKKIAPSTIQNIMIAQSMFGRLAFKGIVSRNLISMNPYLTLDTPFEFYHLHIEDQNNKVNELKAIVVHRSMILARLDWFPPFRRSLAMLKDSRLDSPDKIITIMADVFDRFFGLCYLSDPKYCEEWIENLILFYARNRENKAFFQRLLEESTTQFREVVTQLSFKSYTMSWATNDLSREVNHSDEKLRVMKELLNDARNSYVTI